MPLFGSKIDKKPKGSSKITTSTLTVTTSVVERGPARAEEVFGKKFIATTIADDRADKISDALFGGAGQISSAKALYGTNKTVIDAAWSAMADATGAGRTIDDWIGPITKVMTGLEGLAKAQPFPFVELAVKLFNGVVTLETQRRQNNAKSRALILQMSDMLGTLLQLHFIEDPTLTTDDGESVAGRIQGLMKDIEQDIRNCGALIDKYHKHSLASKFLFSGQYQTQFKTSAEGLVTRKGDIQFACTIHSTVTIDEVRREVRDSNKMIAKLLKIVEYQSEKEKTWEQAVDEYGGRKRVLESPELINRVANQIEGRTSEKSTVLPGDKPDPKAVKTDPKAKKEEPVLSKAELLELQQPLDKLIKDSLPYYEQKLDAKVRLLSVQIEHSTQRILRRLEAGSYERVRHPDIRAVWKEMQWRTSVKARGFVMSLHDYYLDLYAVATSQATSQTTSLSLTITAAESIPPSPMEPQSALDDVSFPSIPTTIVTSTHSITSNNDILEDEWCLSYLTMPYVSAIMEAFDEDGSRSIRISEVNEFCSSIPEGWSLLRWVAYWAKGWQVESAWYAQAINTLLADMRWHMGNVICENSSMVFFYFQDRWTDILRKLTVCANSKSTTSTNSPLDDLVFAHMKQKEKRIEEALNKFDFKLDAPESLAYVCDPGRLEKDLFVLIYVVLKRHCHLVALAKDKQMDETEWLEASATMSHIAEAVGARVVELEGNMRYLGLDVDLELSRYAGGIYAYIHTEEVCDQQSDPILPDDAHEAFWEVVFPPDLDLNSLSKSSWKLDTSAYEKSSVEFDAMRQEGNQLEAPVGEDMMRSPALSVSNLVLDLASNAGDGPALDLGAGGVALQQLHSALQQETLDSSAYQYLLDFIKALEERVATRKGFHFLGRSIAVFQPLAAEQFEKETGLRDRELMAALVKTMGSILLLPATHDHSIPKGHDDGFLERVRRILGPLPLEIARCAWLLSDSGKPKEGTIQEEEAIGNTDAEAPSGNAISEEISTTEENGMPVPEPDGVPAREAEPTGEMKRYEEDRQDLINRLELIVIQVGTTVSLHTSSGVVRFRAAAQTVLDTIKDRHWRYSWSFLKRRRDLRLRYIPRLSEKLMFDDAIASGWEEGDLKGQVEAFEAYNLIAREVSSVDKPLWSGLARKQYRQTIVHMKRRCDNCGKLIVGPRYTCSCCEEFDLCADCASLRLTGIKDWNGLTHHPWHPLLKLARPMIYVPKSYAKELYSMFLRLVQDEDISPEGDWTVDSDSDDSDGDSDSGTDASTDSEVAPEENEEESHGIVLEVPEQVDGDGDPVVRDFALTDAAGGQTVIEQRTHIFTCANCNLEKNGERYLTLRMYGAKQFCPPCETILTSNHGNAALEPYLRVTLRATLPLLDDDEKSTVADDDEKTDEQKVADHLGLVDERLAGLDQKFEAVNGRLSGLEEKMDRLLSLLVALHPSEVT